MTLVSAYKKDFISRNIIDGDITSVQFSSIAQSCLILWDPVDYSTPGLPVHHQLTEFTQTHIHSVSDAMQASHPLSSPSPPTFNLSQHQKTLFKKKRTNQIFCNSLIAQLVKNPPAMQETLVQILGQEYLLEKEYATHSSLLLVFSCGSAGKESVCNAGDLGLILGLGTPAGEGKDYPLQ